MPYWLPTLRALIVGAIICVTIVHASCGRAQTHDESGDDWSEIRPSAAATPKTGTEVQDSSPPPSGSAVDRTMGSASIGPTIATGTISGLRSGGNPEMNLRLRPQPNGFLHGQIEIRQSGFGTTSIEGFVRGDHLQFQVPYGTEMYYFEGERRSDQISGTFESTPSGEHGTWVARAN